MRTIEIQVFKFDELTDEAKEKARGWFRTGFEFGWHAEYRDSLQAIETRFGFDVRKWSVDESSFDYSVNLENSHFRGLKLRDFPRDSMPTGFAGDCGFYMKFHDVWKKTGDPKHAADMALHEFFKEWRDDIESSLSDESVDESIRANEYEFDEDGERV